ncbi:archaemetzincin family Zn-dependent metalloprotease [Nitratiruptor sp. YY09-18]|uniref:archaemetzincin family Zn-dependent metalloprotease n=1 Tax=Nitratiruptor sp. YY09-18 TaxID=2724901 RepID=UPI001914E9CD|nr:archaemetzincin family Zn-dependent metalloprotease [Nitratiruptor sp. YY09-18]BCD68324.1 archaemetzincin [Nitratiruptor sp. YY09-18]
MCSVATIGIVLFNFDEEVGYLIEKLEEIFRIPVSLKGHAKLLQSAYNPTKDQYQADILAQYLLQIPRGTKEVLLGITQADLFEPGMNFVFGVALPSYKVAVVGTKRLHNSFYGLAEVEELYKRRVITEAVHEIGHTLGLEHCPNPHCVMHFSLTLADTDKKGYYFCSSCWQKAARELCIN